MSRTAYVLDADGVVMEIANYDAVRLRLFADYHDGSNYRDEFVVNPQTTPFGAYWGTIPGTSPAQNVVGQVPNMYAEETSSLNSTAPTGLTMKAKLPDSMSHTAPRNEARKRTHLTFYERLTAFEVTASADGDALIAAAHEVGRGAMVTFSNSGGALPAGLVAGKVYWVVEGAGSSFTVAAADPDGGTSPSIVDVTDAGTGTHTCHPLVVVGDFPPGEWSKWGNTMPIRI